jgi:hypothetical protein
VRVRVVFALFVAIVASISVASAQQIVTLPSGMRVHVLNIGPIKFGNGTSALVLSYQTELRVADVVALFKEVDEIWANFRPDVEGAGYTQAVISANEKANGTIVSVGKGYNFVFERAANGTWQKLKSP